MAGLTIGVAGGLMVALGIFWALSVAWEVTEMPPFPRSLLAIEVSMAALCAGVGLVVMGLGNFVARRRTRSTS